MTFSNLLQQASVMVGANALSQALRTDAHLALMRKRQMLHRLGKNSLHHLIDDTSDDASFSVQSHSQIASDDGQLCVASTLMTEAEIVPISNTTNLSEQEETHIEVRFDKPIMLQPN